jgi:hypothetical protein
MAEECDIEVVVPNFMLNVKYTNVYRERRETQLAVTNVFAELPPIRHPPNPYLGVVTEMPPNPYLGGSRTPPNHTAYYKIIHIENNGLNVFNLICFEGSYDGHTDTWGPNEIIYTTTRLCEMLRNGRIILPRNLQPNYEKLMRSIKGGTTKKRHFRKSKKSKRTKSKSRTRRGGGLSSKQLWEQIKELQNKSKNLQDDHERKKLEEVYIDPLFLKWEKATEAEAQAKETIVYDGGRRSRRGAIKKKYKKARKSCRRTRS